MTDRMVTNPIQETVSSRVQNLYSYNRTLGSTYGKFIKPKPEYFSNLKSTIKLCRDLMIDQEHIRSIRKYLNYNPKFLSQGSEGELARDNNYLSFKNSTVLNNLFKKYVNSIISNVMNGRIEVEIDNEQIMETLETAARSSGSYLKFIKEVLFEIMVAGSCMIFVDYELTLTIEGEQERKVVLKHYAVENIDTVRMDANGNILEATIKTRDRKGETVYWYFYSDPERNVPFIIHILDDAKVLQRTIDYSIYFELSFPPIFLVGIDGILTTVHTPLPPLADIAHLTIAMFQEIGKRNYSAIPLLISRLFLTGMNAEDVTTALRQTGSQAIVSPILEAKAQVLESNNNHISDFNSNIEMYQTQIDSYINGESNNRLERETAEGVRSRSNQKNSLICDLSKSMEEIIYRLVRLISLMIGVNYNNLEINIKVGREIGTLPIEKDLAMFFYNQATEGLFPVELLDTMLKEVSVLPRTVESQEFINSLNRLLREREQKQNEMMERQQTIAEATENNTISSQTDTERTEQ